MGIAWWMSDEVGGAVPEEEDGEIPPPPPSEDGGGREDLFPSRGTWGEQCVVNNRRLVKCFVEGRHFNENDAYSSLKSANFRGYNARCQMVLHGVPMKHRHEGDGLTKQTQV